MVFATIRSSIMPATPTPDSMRLLRVVVLHTTHSRAIFQTMPAGVSVCLTCFNGGCAGDRNHAMQHYRITSHPIVLNIKKIKKPVTEQVCALSLALFCVLFVFAPSSDLVWHCCIAQTSATTHSNRRRSGCCCWLGATTLLAAYGCIILIIFFTPSMMWRFGLGKLASFCR